MVVHHRLLIKEVKLHRPFGKTVRQITYSPLKVSRKSPSSEYPEEGLEIKAACLSAYLEAAALAGSAAFSASAGLDDSTGLASPIPSNSTSKTSTLSGPIFGPAPRAP